MTPLMNVLFGAIFLRERLTRWQLASVLLAALGVLNLTFGYGRFPWIAVSLCLTFGLYGLLRKKSGTAAIPGLFIETILLVPFAVIFLFYLQHSGAMVFGRAGPWLSILLISTGVITAVPLFWFGYATLHHPEHAAVIQRVGQEFLLGRHHGTREKTGAEVTGDFAGLYTLRNGKVSRVQFYADRHEALKAVGLEE